jgi:hypothetical protein
MRRYGRLGRHRGGQKLRTTTTASHEEPGLLLRIRQRAIRLEDMHPLLRLAVGVAFVQLVVAATLVLLRELPWPTMNVATADARLLAMPTVVFWASVAFLVLAWGYVLAAGLHAPIPVRAIVLAAYTAAHWSMLEAAAIDPRAGIVAAAGVGLAWLAGGAVWIVHRRDRTQQSSRGCFDVRLLGIGLVPTLLVYAAAYWSEHGVTSLSFAMSITIELHDLSWILIPVLFLAGADFAEWGELIGARVARTHALVHRPRLVAAVTAVLALLTLGVEVPDLGGQLIPQIGGVLLAGVGIGALLRGARAGAHWPVHVPGRAVVLAGLGYLLVFEALAILPNALAQFQQPPATAEQSPVGGQLKRYVHDEPPSFSLEYPSLWSARSLTDGPGDGATTYVDFDGTVAADPARIWVLGMPRQVVEAEFNDPNAFLPTWLKRSVPEFETQVGEPTASGEWQVRPFTLTKSTDGSTLTGTAWQRVDGDTVWVLGSTTPPQWSDRYAPLFASMVDSWRAGPTAPDAATGTTAEAPAIAAFVGFGCVVLAIAGALVLVRGAGRGATPMGWLYVCVFGLLAALTIAPTIAETFLGLQATQVPYLRLEGVRCVVAGITLLWIAVLSVRRAVQREAHVIVVLLVLNIALQVVAWTVDLYTTTTDLGGRFSVAQAVVLILAVVWDVALSGETITNRHGRFFPRQTRVLLHLGYEMLVATAIVYFTSLQVQATGAGFADSFESDTWPRLGVVVLGLPLVLTLAAVRLAAGRRLVRRQRNDDPLRDAVGAAPAAAQR